MMILTFLLFLPHLGCTYASIAVRQLVQESSNGHVFVTAAGEPTVSSSTSVRPSISQSLANSTFTSGSESLWSTTSTESRVETPLASASSTAKLSSVTSIDSSKTSSPIGYLASSRSSLSSSEGSPGSSSAPIADPATHGSTSSTSRSSSANSPSPVVGSAAGLYTFSTSGSSLSGSPSSIGNSAASGSTSSTSGSAPTSLSAGSSTSVLGLQASPASSTYPPFPASTVSTASRHGSTLQASASSSFSPTTNIKTAASSTGNGANLGAWPASITYCSLSSGQPVIVVGFVTTSADGSSTITNTTPSQSVISKSQGASCVGEIVVSNSGSTTTIELSTLPIASTFTQDVTAQTLTISGTPVVYSPTTLPGYDNTEPIEISTSFVETVNGQTTTQWGWWLIGPYGRIDPPNNRPWRTGSGNFGCIGGPLLCNAPCGDVDVGGGWFVHIPFAKCTPGITGPPGWPGGPVVVGPGGPDDDPPPYPEGPADPGNDDPEDCDEEGVECSKTTTTATGSSVSSLTSSGIMTTTRTSTSLLTSSGTASKTAYFVIAATNAVQSVIEQEFEDINPGPDASFEPDVNSTEFSGGTWIDVELTPQQASSISSRSDIAFVMTCASATFFSADPMPTTVSAAITVTLVTLTADPTPSAYRPKKRRLALDQRPQTPQATRFGNGENERKLDNSVYSLNKRDPGTDLVRQKESPKDLSVLAWAPMSVASVAEVDYILEQTKGEFTWVYVVDRGVDDTHWEFQDNWEGIDGFGKINIDPDWVWAPGMDQVKEDPTGHGTCMASKVCGKKSGVAKQAIVIPAVFDSSYQSCIAVLQQLEIDIRTRQGNPGNPQALAGKTVVSISWGFYIMDPDYITQFKNALQGIMNLGVVVVVSAGNSKLLSGPVSQFCPEVLALSDGFPLIRVGAADESGLSAYFSQEGDVYTEGVAAKCAAAGFSFFEKDVDGTSGATAAFAGLVAYMMGLETVPFAFGNDPTQYQRIVKDYFVTGPGAYVRPGGDCPVAWNGLDGSPKTVCPLSLRKRQEQPDDICQLSSTSSSSSSSSTIPSMSSSAIPTQTPNWINNIIIAIYYSEVEPCDGTSSECDLTYYAYAIGEIGRLPLQECGGALGQGSSSVQFQIGTLAGVTETFTYSVSSNSAGTITGNSLASPIACSNSSSQAAAWKCSLTKRSVYPDYPPPSRPQQSISYYPLATCEWIVS